MKKIIFSALLILSAVPLFGKIVEPSTENSSGILFYFYPNGILPDDLEVPTYNLIENNGDYPAELKKIAILRGIDPRVNGGFLQKDLSVPEFIEVDGEFIYVGGVNCAFINANCKNIFLPDGICRIESDSFMGAQLLEEVTLPASLTYLGSRTFLSAKGLKKIKMRSVLPPACEVKTDNGNIILRIGDSLPENVDEKSLPISDKSILVYVPKGSKWVYQQHPCFANLRLMEYEPEYAAPYLKNGDSAARFKLGCTGNFSLQLIDKGNGSGENIPSEVFGEGYVLGISTAEHPYRVTSVAGNAFSNTGESNLIIPNTIELIGDKSFTGLKLNSLYIPSSVKYIGTRSFSDSPSVRRVILNLPKDGSKLFCAENAFAGTLTDAILYVDKNSGSIDLTQKPWCDFKEIRDISELSQQ